MIARVRLSNSKTLRCRACRIPLIVRLYETRNDNLPTHSRRDFSASGFVHNALHQFACPDCMGEHPAMKRCRRCGGRGYTEERVARDPYSTDHIPVAGTDTRKLGHVPSRDAELTRLASQTRAPFTSIIDELADADEHPYAWERARTMMFERYDYRALDIALDELWNSPLDVHPMSPQGLAFIDQRMPERIRAPRVSTPIENVPAKGVSAGTRALADRDALVRELAAQGVGYDEIARRVGLSARQLRRVINERTEAA